MTINIFFVRHGQTLLNMYNRIQGICDAPLTEKGVNDAKNAGKKLSEINFDAAYSSDAPRAIRTAKLILEPNSSQIKAPTIDTAFREENFGYFEGNNGSELWSLIGGPHGVDTFNDIMNKFGMNKTLDMLHDADWYNNAESSKDVKERFEPGLKRVIDNANDGDNILITSHGTFIRWMASEYGNVPTDHSTRNGSVTKMVVNNGKPDIEYFDKLDTDF